MDLKRKPIFWPTNLHFFPPITVFSNSSLMGSQKLIIGWLHGPWSNHNPWTEPVKGPCLFSLNLEKLVDFKYTKQNWKEWTRWKKRLVSRWLSPKHVRDLTEKAKECYIISSCPDMNGDERIEAFEKRECWLWNLKSFTYLLYMLIF